MSADTTLTDDELGAIEASARSVMPTDDGDVYRDVTERLVLVAMARRAREADRLRKERDEAREQVAKLREALEEAVCVCETLHKGKLIEAYESRIMHKDYVLANRCDSAANQLWNAAALIRALIDKDPTP